MLYIKDFFWDIQSSKLYYCRWSFGYRLYVFSVVSLSMSLLRTVWWEWGCLRRLFKFLFWALYVFWILSLALVGKLSNILKHFQISDVSLLLYNLSLMLLQYNNFCNNLSMFGDCVQLIKPILLFGKNWFYTQKGF